MRMTYHVYHDYDAAKQSIEGLMHTFDDDREEHEYHCFPMTLRHNAPNVDVSMSCRQAKDRKGVVVTLISKLADDVIIDALSQVLIKQNTDIPGLCLVAKRIG